MTRTELEGLEHANSSFPVICSHTFYAPPLSTKSVVIDLGSCSASFSHVIAKLYGCKCHAVEATSENFNNIKETELVSKYHYAISNKNKNIEIALADEEYHWGSIQKLDGIDYLSVETVHGITLEKFLRSIGQTNPDLVKVDIEGAEFDLFSSTSDTSLQSIGQFTVEFHDFINPDWSKNVSLLKERMQDLGFYVFTFTNKYNGDVLFINKSIIPFSKIKKIRTLLEVKLLRGINRIVRRYA